MTNNNKLWAGLLILVIFFIYNQQPSTPTTTPSGSSVDLADITNPSYIFRGQDLYVSGSALSSESVRIIKTNGDRYDLGYKSLNSGTLNVEPGNTYAMYFFLNDTAPSGTYYVDKQVVTAPSKDSATTLTGKGCNIDTRLIYNSYDTNGQRQTSSSYAISLTANEMKDIDIKIQTYMDECYGSPSATQGNVVCFGYNSTAIKLVESTTRKVPTPLGISNNNNATGLSLSCYEFDVLQDGGDVVLPVHIESDASTEPTILHNITVFSDDINFDINGDNLAEIEGFDDEDGNNLGAPVKTLGYIYLS